MEEALILFMITILVLYIGFTIYTSIMTESIIKANSYSEYEAEEKKESLVDKYMLDLDSFMKEGKDIEITTETELREFVLLLIYFNLNGSFIIIDKFEGDKMLAALSLYYGFQANIMPFLIDELYKYLAVPKAERNIVKLGKALKDTKENSYKHYLMDLTELLTKMNKQQLIMRINN